MSQVENHRCSILYIDSRNVVVNRAVIMMVCGPTCHLRQLPCQTLAPLPPPPPLPPLLKRERRPPMPLQRCYSPYWLCCYCCWRLSSRPSCWIFVCVYRCRYCLCLHDPAASHQQLSACQPCWRVAPFSVHCPCTAGGGRRLLRQRITLEAVGTCGCGGASSASQGRPPSGHGTRCRRPDTALPRGKRREGTSSPAASRR